MARLCFILKKSPYTGENLKTLYNMAISALKKDHEVFIYLSSEGVYSSLRTLRSNREGYDPKGWLSKLSKSGAEIIYSNHDIKSRGLYGGKNYVQGLKSGGLADLSEAIANADKVVTL